MKKTNKIIAAFLMIISLIGYLVNPTIIMASTLNNSYVDFSENIGGAAIDEFNSISETADGGYIVSGSSLGANGALWGHESGPYIHEAITVKVDADGMPQWAKSLGAAGNSVFAGVTQTTDGGYIAVGETQGVGTLWGYVGSIDALIVKFSAAGVILWAKSLGTAVEEQFYTVTATTDGGAIAVGFSAAANGGIWGNNGGYDAIIVKFAADGTIEWSHNEGGSGDDRYKSIAATADNGYIAFGVSYSANGALWNNIGSGDSILVKYSSDGTRQWSKNVGSANLDEASCVKATSDGGFVISGTEMQMHPQFGYPLGIDHGIIGKYAADGSEEWYKTYGAGQLTVFNSVAVLSDGNYAVAGLSNEANGTLWGNNGGEDAIVVNIDKNGTAVSGRNLGSTDYERFNSLTASMNGKYAAAGYSNEANAPLWGNNGAEDGIIVAFAADFIITEKYQDKDDNTLQDTTTSTIQGGENYTKTAPPVTGYNYLGYQADGGDIHPGNAVLNAVTSDHTITFIYDEQTVGYIITENFVDVNGDKIQDSTQVTIPNGGNYAKDHPDIKGWIYKGYKFDDEVMNTDNQASIRDVTASHTVSFIYEKVPISKNPKTGDSSTALQLFMAAGIALIMLIFTCKQNCLIKR